MAAVVPDGKEVSLQVMNLLGIPLVSEDEVGEVLPKVVILVGFGNQLSVVKAELRDLGKDAHCGSPLSKGRDPLGQIDWSDRFVVRGDVACRLWIVHIGLRGQEGGTCHGSRRHSRGGRTTSTRARGHDALLLNHFPRLWSVRRTPAF